MANKLGSKLGRCSRARLSLLISLLVHFAIFALLSICGVFALAKSPEHNAEVTFFAVGGGGGGGGGAEMSVAEAESAEEAEADSVIDGAEEIADGQTPAKPAQVSKKARLGSSFTSQRGVGSGSGSGGGHGSGHGTGIGSGTGSGSGSGSGGGHGSCNGAGYGSGIVRQPAVPPRVTRTQAPNYPAHLKQSGVEGVSVLRLVIGTDGSVEEVVIARSSGHGDLDAAALAAARQWRFSPAKNEQGQRVRCYYQLPMRFSLEYQ